MRQVLLLRFALKEIRKGSTFFLLSTLLILLSFLGIGYYFMISNESSFHRAECDRALTYGIDGTGAMQVFGDYEAQRALKKESMDSGKLECIGTWLSMNTTNPIAEELLERRLANGDKEKRRTVWTYVDRSVLSAHNLTFAQKKEVPEEWWQNPHNHGIYLGGNYEGIALGSVYELSVFGASIDCEVLGILKKGQQMVSNMVMADGRGNGIYTMESLDNVILMVEETYVSDQPKGACNWAFVPAKGVSLREARSYLETKAAELGLNIETAYLKDGFAAEEIEQRDVRRIDLTLCLVICVTCLLICSCLQYVQVLQERQKLGILYGMGFDDEDMLEIYALQGILKVFVAFGLAYLALRKLGEGYFDGMTVPANLIKSVNQWICYAALPAMLCFGIGLLLVLIGIPVLMTRTARPAILLANMAPFFQKGYDVILFAIGLFLLFYLGMSIVRTELLLDKAMEPKYLYQKEFYTDGEWPLETFDQVEELLLGAGDNCVIRGVFAPVGYTNDSREILTYLSAEAFAKKEKLDLAKWNETPNSVVIEGRLLPRCFWKEGERRIIIGGLEFVVFDVIERETILAQSVHLNWSNLDEERRQRHRYWQRYCLEPYGDGLYLQLQSLTSFGEEVPLFETQFGDIMRAPKSFTDYVSGWRREIYRRMKIFYLIAEGFGVLCVYYLSELLFARRRRECAIKRMLGFGLFRILGASVREVMTATILAFAGAMLLQLAELGLHVAGNIELLDVFWMLMGSLFLTSVMEILLFGIHIVKMSSVGVMRNIINGAST